MQLSAAKGDRKQRFCYLNKCQKLADGSFPCYFEVSPCHKSRICETIECIQYETNKKVIIKKWSRSNKAARIYKDIEIFCLDASNHPFIPKLDYIINVQLYTAIVMTKYGVDLSKKQFSIYGARFVASEVLLAIRYLHSRAIYHRDIKPSNIVLAEDGHIRLIDYGTCVVYGRDPCSACVTAGTPHFMAPEMLRDMMERDKRKRRAEKAKRNSDMTQTIPNLCRCGTSSLMASRSTPSSSITPPPDCSQAPESIMRGMIYSDSHQASSKDPRKIVKTKRHLNEDNDELISNDFCQPGPSGRSADLQTDEEDPADNISQKDKHYARTCMLDYWSFGVTFYYFVTGHLMFEFIRSRYDYKELYEAATSSDRSMVRLVSRVNNHAGDLILSLLQPHLQNRLGYPHNIMDICNHQFFESVDWSDEEKLWNRRPPSWSLESVEISSTRRPWQGGLYTTGQLTSEDDVLHTTEANELTKALSPCTVRVRKLSHADSSPKPSTSGLQTRSPIRHNWCWQDGKLTLKLLELVRSRDRFQHLQFTGRDELMTVQSNINLRSAKGSLVIDQEPVHLIQGGKRIAKEMFLLEKGLVVLRDAANKHIEEFVINSDVDLRQCWVEDKGHTFIIHVRAKEWTFSRGRGMHSRFRKFFALHGGINDALWASIA